MTLDVAEAGERAATPLAPEELAAAGRAARAALPRSAHAEYAPPPGRDPMGILRSQHRDRLQNLVDLRVERMSADAFAFYRGTAAIQAADLAGAPTTGAEVVVCGDAHISNFGVYRSPENAMVFDINDFDESTVGPWEWDVKRLLTSVVLAGRALGMSPEFVREATWAAGEAYRRWLEEALTEPLTARFFTPMAVTSARGRLSPDMERLIRQVTKESKKRTAEHTARRTLQADENGVLRFIERPPILRRAEPEVQALAQDAYDRYRRTLPPNTALLASQLRLDDVARRVVGVGSVGTRCFVIALRGPVGEPVILQLKEARASVVERFGGVAPLPGYLDLSLLPDDQGYRVVACQRILQAVSDPFLGFLRVEGFAFYLRLFRNRNASFDIPSMNAAQFSDYVRVCAVALARAHARSPKAAFISGYLGSGPAFSRAATAWAERYADQAEADYREFVEVARAGGFAVT
ncbi:DUF2252 domain-containing protein [Leifsonia sp. 21MFCrub1.1]|uniref:DUF2252 domain-containing protein n=1 Tax=Leifsonia sp. 21MFCrub1.1 TaxID=1798223 RepID=UPI0008929AC4|nr:DUF2252 domain-containing protein [Leifsonia sp. 21MFCrub1.1]SEA97452.1 Uncharacterized conserved protein, DUF2252 family [Leifsonia sp. 21MFCrub1.1]